MSDRWEDIMEEERKNDPNRGVQTLHEILAERGWRDQFANRAQWELRQQNVDRLVQQQQQQSQFQRQCTCSGTTFHSLTCPRFGAGRMFGGVL